MFSGGRLIKFLSFSSLVFFPAYAIFGFFILGMGLSFIIEPRLLDLALIAIMALLALSMSYFCHRHSTTSSTFTRIFAVNYFGWIILGSVISYFISASMAGISMAVVDGSVGGYNLFMQEVIFALELLAASHIFIVPWVLATTYIIRRHPIYFT